MQRNATEERRQKNPFRHPDVKPDWAQLTRLGGDRVAILFEELRRRVGVIDALVEDLHFAGAEEGWMPRYRQGDRVLFTVRLLPGSLEVTLRMDVLEREILLASRKVGAAMKRVLRDGRAEAGGFATSLVLGNQADVRSFSSLVVHGSRLNIR